MIKYKFVLIFISLLVMSCTSENPVEKLGSKDWQVVQIEDISKFDKAPTMTFNISGSKVNGNAGCNKFFGDATINESEISFGNLGSTKMLCPDMTAEDAFFKVAGNISKYKFEDDRLILLSDNGDRIMVLE